VRLIKGLLISFVVGAILFLSACKSFPSKNRDSQRDNKEMFRKDLRECKEDYPESSAGLHFQRWSDCMNLKGWE
jgi:hypothetical protein